MNGPADTTEGAAAAFRRSSRHRASQRRAREDRWRNDRSARVLYAPGGSPWRRHHGLCRYARGARDHREFEGWSEHDHDRKQNQLHRRGNRRQPRCRRDNAGPPRSAHDGVANARYDNRGEARCDRDANAASAMRPLLELASSPLLRQRDHRRGALGRRLRHGAPLPASSSHRDISLSPCVSSNASRRLRMMSPGRSEGMCISILRVTSTMASGSVDSNISRSSSMMAASQSISSCVEQSSSRSLRNRICTSWMLPSSMGVAELKMICRSPEGYSISSVRQNGMNQALRMCRLVTGSVVPVTRNAAGGLLMGTIVSAWKP